MIKIKMVCLLTAIAIVTSCNNPTSNPTPIATTPTATTDKPKSFIGTWTDKEAYHIVEITDTGTKFRIRERYGVNENAGTEYFASSINNVLTAEGKEEDFYKLQLPTFRFLENNQLYYDYGAGPDTLIKSDKPLPNANCKYLPPRNND